MTFLLLRIFSKWRCLVILHYLITVIIIWIHVLRISAKDISTAQAHNLCINCTWNYSFFFRWRASTCTNNEFQRRPPLTGFTTLVYYLMKVSRCRAKLGNYDMDPYYPECYSICVEEKWSSTRTHRDLDICNACNLLFLWLSHGAIDMSIYNGERKAILSPD